MKFYVHCKDPGFTIVVDWAENDSRSVHVITEIFLRSLEKKYCEVVNNIDQSSICIKRGSSILNQTKSVKETMKNMDDLYISWKLKDSTCNITNEVRCRSLEKDLAESGYDLEELLKLAKSLYDKFRLQYAMAIYEDILKRDPSHTESLLGLGACYMKAGRYHEAKKFFERIPSIIETGYQLGKCYLECGDADLAVETLMSYVKEKRATGGMDILHKQNTQVLLAKGFIKKGHKDMAITILEGVLRENVDHLGALVEYASLIWELSPEHKEESVRIMLKALANNRDNKYIKEKFATVVCQRDGLKILEKVSGSAWKDVNAIVFMATSLRDAGAIDEALKLMEHAFSLDPKNAHTLLTFVHMMELTEDHSSAVRKIQVYVESYPEEAIHSFSCGMLKDILKPFTRETELYLHNPSVPFLDPSIAVTSSLTPYDEDTRYLLALLFTLVKILFVKGALSYIPPIVKLLDPLTEGQDLHRTNVRNEAAYYTCISQIIQQSYPPLPTQSSPFIYFVGDSHCIPPAWQSIKYKNKTRVIHPILSTGTKIWHLREEGKFYPKHDFYSSISQIPSASEVIFCFGEIDCREALLLCVEKGKYDTLESAMDKLIDIYVELLMGLREKYHWKIYVHPVMPVLDITRDIVMQFNEHLSKRLLNIPELQWCRFVEELLVEINGEKKLNSKYGMDGTHANPSYLCLLEHSIERLQ